MSMSKEQAARIKELKAEQAIDFAVMRDRLNVSEGMKKVRNFGGSLMLTLLPTRSGTEARQIQMLEKKHLKAYLKGKKFFFTYPNGGRGEKGANQHRTIVKWREVPV